MHIRDVAVKAHETQIEKGFASPHSQRNFGEMIALIHSELSEALEGHRENSKTPLPLEQAIIEQEIDNIKSTSESAPTYSKFKGCVPFELADAVIRILGMTEELGIKDFEWYIEQKMKYNRKRPYLHGKKY